MANLDIVRGRQVIAYLTNGSGGSVADGDVVIYNTSADEGFTTTTTPNANTIGMGVAQETIYNGSNGRILVSGYAPRVNVNGSNVSTGNRNYYLFTSQVAKSARYAASRGAGTFGQLIDSGLTPAAIVQPLPDTTGLANPMTTQGDIIYASDGSGTPARLAASTSGYFLKTNGAGTNPTWAALPFSGCKVYNSATQSFNASTLTTITYNSEEYDTNAYHDTGSNTGRLVAPFTGYYRVGAGIWYATTTGTNYVLIDKNSGASYIRGGATAQNGGGSGIFLTTTILLTAGDYLTIVGYHTEAGSVATGDNGGTPSQQNWATMEFLGA